ncbi:MAG: hypothetical protein ACE5LS_07760 [Thermoplasmata archaeon]
MAKLFEPGNNVMGEKLVAVGRKIGRVFVLAERGARRVQRVLVWGEPARCYVDRPVRLT